MYSLLTIRFYDDYDYDNWYYHNCPVCFRETLWFYVENSLTIPIRDECTMCKYNYNHDPKEWKAKYYKEYDYWSMIE